jgi:sodium-dependent dicarboxylate transporter 2/3/5
MAKPIQIDPKGNITFNVNLYAFFKLFIIIGLAFAARYVPLPEMTEASRICMMIFVGAAGLWITEAIPPFATAIAVIVLSTYLLGQPGGPLGFDESGYRVFLNPVASPVIVLFFGGLILAAAISKHGFDIRVASALIKPFGRNPKNVLLGIILTTGCFSMFMSNTATTAMMMAILTPLLKHFEGREQFKKAMVLAVPFSATIGGIGTIIGTPPNAVAASVLASMGYGISFMQWAMIGIPMAFILLFTLWFILIKGFKPSTEELDVLFPEPIGVTWDLVVVVVTFFTTLLLWLTEPLHGLNASVVALLPVMVFTMLGILDHNDLKRLDWDILILVAGGLTLGVAMQTSGLSEILVQQLALLTVPTIVWLLIIVLSSTMIANFMSHVSASNMIIPIVASLAVMNPRVGTMAATLACSMAMSFTISTPSNAIAYATRTITTKELAKYGTMISVLGITLIMIVSVILMQFWR